MLTDALERLYMEEFVEGRSAKLVVDALTIRDKLGSLLGDGNPRSLKTSLSLLIPICLGLENNFFFFCFSGCGSDGWDPARGNTILAAVVATFGAAGGGGSDGEGWLIRSGGGTNGGEALALRRPG